MASSKTKTAGCGCNARKGLAAGGGFDSAYSEWLYAFDRAIKKLDPVYSNVHFREPWLRQRFENGTKPATAARLGYHEKLIKGLSKGSTGSGKRGHAHGDRLNERQRIGLAMQNWHSSSGDPIYAVGSYYFSDMDYPDPDVVESARDSISTLIRRTTIAKDATELRRIRKYLDAVIRENDRKGLAAGAADSKKRYSMKDVPTAQIEFIVGRMSVGATDAEVAADIDKRTRSWPEQVRKLAREYAIKTHHKNIGTYSAVMGGRLGRGR